MSAAADMKDLYRELILDHSRNPRHFGRVEDATHSADGINPLCGDKLRLYLRVNDDGEIESSSFEGSGCAISVASASLMTDAVTGITPAAAGACLETLTRRLTEDPGVPLPQGFDKLMALDGVREYPMRVKCATLAWHALRAALNDETAPATTE